jgi:L-alanine-DL-glutamate epimerase-like enolase superfamily enzyme
MKLTISATVETWPIEGTFVISRGARTEAEVVVAEISDGDQRGRGECVPYLHYSETVDGVVADIKSATLGSTDRSELQKMMAPGAARNALDCALWDLQAKQSGIRVAALCGYAQPRARETAYTISLGIPETMAEAAAQQAHRPLLKLKLGGDGDAERVRAVRAAAPASRIIVDANEAWSPVNCLTNLRACADVGVALVEQPLKADDDEMLRDIPHIVPICADESIHTLSDLDRLAGKYDGVNIKLDKAGGLTEARALCLEARERGYLIMVGCMLGTSLAMAPAIILAQDADIVDLDGPLLLARDRTPALVYAGAMVSPPEPELWG